MKIISKNLCIKLSKIAEYIEIPAEQKTSYPFLYDALCNTHYEYLIINQLKISLILLSAKSL